MGKRAANRLCPSCKERQAVSYSTYCKQCANEKQKKYYRRKGRLLPRYYKEKIRNFIKEVKQQPCVDCEIEYPWYVMDFDHVRGEKKFNLSRCASKLYSLDTIKKEIDKCEVVCANCHRERTFSRIER